MKLFAMDDAVKRTGATLRQIDHLVTVGLVRPGEAAPRRGMSRQFTLASLRYIAVAARLLTWGVGVDDIKSMIGNDKPIHPKLGLNQTFIEEIWGKLRSSVPEISKSVEFLVVFRMTDPNTKRTLGFMHAFAPAESLASAAGTSAETKCDYVVINMATVAAQVDEGL